VTSSVRNAVVTGASRGIGHGIARQLASDGWSLTINGRDPEQLAAVAAELEDLGASVRTVAGDVADDATVEKMIEVHGSAHDFMSALVLAAGVGSAGPVADYPMRRFDKQFAVNIRGPFALISKALPLLRAAGLAAPDHGGRILAITSIEGIYPESGLAAYSASKAALMSLVRSVNAEENANGVTATAISPGFVDTAMSAWTADTVPPATMIPVSDIVKVAHLVLSISRNAVLPHIVINRSAGGAYHA
jgi:3-oxoacyl-[acyl-carrier protein] reductase